MPYSTHSWLASALVLFAFAPAPAWTHGGGGGWGQPGVGGTGTVAGGGGKAGKGGNPGTGKGSKKNKGEESPSGDSAGEPTPASPTRGPATKPPSAPTGGPVTSPTGPGTPASPQTPRSGTGGATRRNTSNPDRWELWWYAQRELYLRRHAPTAPFETTPSGGFLSGHKDPAAVAAGLLDESARRSLMPLFANALRDRSSEIADSAAIALGRSVWTKDAGPIIAMLETNLAHTEESPRQAALLALGMVGAPETIARLRDVVLDTPAGRKLCGASGSLDEMLRGLAALSLGLIGTQEAAEPLLELATAATTSRELASCAILGLGLQRDGAPATVVTLARLLDDRSLDRMVRAQVPVALARLPASASRSVLPRLLDVFVDRKTPAELNRSVAIALGRIATPDDTEVIDRLLDAVALYEDSGTRQFALLSLGRLFERPAIYDAAAVKRRSAVQNFLLDQLRHPAQQALKPFAALALGLFGRGDPKFGGQETPANHVAAARLLEMLAEDLNPSNQGAVAIALGLLRSPDAGTALRARLVAIQNPTLRGHLATALGMLGDKESIPLLDPLVEDTALPATTRIDVARGLAMIGDTTSEGHLLELLAKTDTYVDALAYSKALGLVGGRKSIEALSVMAEDRELPDLQRSFAVIALGMLAEKTLEPWNTGYMVDANYLLPLRPLEEVISIL